MKLKLLIFSFILASSKNDWSYFTFQPLISKPITTPAYFPHVNKNIPIPILRITDLAPIVPSED